MRKASEILEDLQMLEACNELHRKSIKDNQKQMEALSMEYDNAKKVEDEQEVLNYLLWRSTM